MGEIDWLKSARGTEYAKEPLIGLSNPEDQLAIYHGLEELTSYPLNNLLKSETVKPLGKKKKGPMLYELRVRQYRIAFIIWNKVYGMIHFFKKQKDKQKNDVALARKRVDLMIAQIEVNNNSLSR